MNVLTDFNQNLTLDHSNLVSEVFHQDEEILQDMEDEALMSRVAEDDIEAFSILMERHLNRITALAARVVYQGGDAEDAAQEVFINVWKHKATWMQWRSSFSTWLYRITVHKCIDLNKKARFSSLDDASEPVCGALNVVSKLHVAQFSKHLAKAISELSEGQQMAITLHYEEGMSAQDCAKVLNMKTSAVEGLLKRARQKIRELLDGANLLEDRVDAPNQICLSM